MKLFRFEYINCVCNKYFMSTICYFCRHSLQCASHINDAYHSSWYSYKLTFLYGTNNERCWMNNFIRRNTYRCIKSRVYGNTRCIHWRIVLELNSTMAKAFQHAVFVLFFLLVNLNLWYLKYNVYLVWMPCTGRVRTTFLSWCKYILLWAYVTFLFIYWYAIHFHAVQ